MRALCIVRAGGASQPKNRLGWAGVVAGDAGTDIAAGGVASNAHAAVSSMSVRLVGAEGARLHYRPRFAPIGDGLFTYPDFDPVALSIGPLFGYGPILVRWYGIMYLVGFTLGWLGARTRAKRPESRIKPEHIDDIVFYVALGAVIGGRIGYMLVYGLSELVSDPLSIVKVWQGGMSFHGGLVGVLAAMWLYGRSIKQPFFVVMDFIAPWVPFGLFAGRIGNFINGELWGKPTSPDAPWAVIVDGQARHASQLYEAFFEGIVLFLVLWLFTQKPRPTMATSGLFLLVYGIGRFIVEFVRVPDAQMGYLALGWVTMGQVLTAPMILAGVILLLLAYRRKEAA